MTLFTLFILSIILLILLYKWSTANYNILNERNVPHKKPKPLVGNLGANILSNQSILAKVLMELHLKFHNAKVYGMYLMRHPFIIIRDTELIRKVLVTDFYNFTNHQSHMQRPDSSLGKNLYILKDQEWREMRDILTPIFTNIKMRAIFELINECCLEGVIYLEQKFNQNKKYGLDLQMNDIFSRFTNDIISSAALGIKVVSFQQKETTFFKIGTTVMNFSGKQMTKAALMQMMPKLMKTIGLKVFNTEAIKHFNNIVLTAIKYREQHQIVRPDMIQLLSEAQKENATKLAQNEKCFDLRDKDIAAQCLLFFCAGFAKVRSSLCSTAYELIENPTVQEKLYEEISLVQKQLNGKPLNYDNLMNMKYMEMVVAESLRKWPPCTFTNRISSQDYKLMDDDGNIIVELKKDDNICIPILGLQRDPVNFENPDLFDPERFSAEKIKNIRPFTYQPFGSGPRACIGNQLAVIEIKIILYHLLLRYKFVSSSKTKGKLFDKMSGYLPATEKLWLKLLPRSSK